MAHPTKDAAIDKAYALAVKQQESMYVVWCGDGYAVADEFDLDTWWQGATVLGEVQPDGTFVHAE